MSPALSGTSPSASRRREQLKFLSSVTQQVSDSVIVTDKDHKIIYINDAAENLFGYKMEELRGLTPRALDAEFSSDAIRDEIGQATSSGKVWEGEVVNRRKDGSTLLCELKISPLYEERGRISSRVTIIRDITERKQAEKREQELQQELSLSRRLASIGELAAGVAHEINNPLTGILGFSERLLQKNASEEISRDLERIHHEAKRAAKVVDSLLTFARRHEPKKLYVDINEILQKTLELRDYSLKTSNIKVALDLDTSLPKTIADFYQIQEVFLNIIVNAEQAIDEAKSGRKLSIKTQQVKDYIKISFTDDGPGIPAEQLDRIFDPFFTTRGEMGGTGLGLSVCHGIVTEHGGRIYARSKPGKGATFSVELPLTTKEIDSSKIGQESPASGRK